MRDKDSIECEVCGDVLIKWNGGVFYTNEGLIERKEPPTKK
jgi:ribosomal protein S27E